ncbi:MAG: VCBS repeat-containing protein [Verrucomicrobiaceae bacterium]|nr:VCBS repeat-containing protein [Verrucomicrobiaceae bacterium]
MKVLLALVFAATSLHAATQITWERKQLHGDFYSEGAAIGDINGDGKPDIVAGPFWWEGPAFEKKHAYYEPKIFSINGYSDNFFAYVHDFNGDKKNDILILGFPGKEARLYLNSGVHDDKPWPMSIVADVVDNESPVFTDITGDGKPEIVCSTGGKFGWFAPNWDKPTEKWPFVAVSEDMKVAKFTHGLGVGDVNGDGKLDLLEARRWWEHKDSGLWEQHNFAAGVGGGAQMFAYDFDGNGTNDVFTSLQAHRYGVAVYLQNKPQGSADTPVRSSDPGGEAAKHDDAGKSARAPLPNWKQVMLASENPADNDYGIVFSQPHAAALADINGDGIQDIVTGKRYWAHNGHDPDERGARVVYWYETKRDGKGGVDFIPHLVDTVSSVGVDVTVGDVNGDGLPDIVSANKSGVFILTQKRTDSTAEAKPVKMYGPGLKPQIEYARGQPPQDALKNLQLPTGFKADLIAAEPDIVQPIAFCFDERGRLWVVEGNSYPQPREVGAGKDRIRILEDSDGDGTYETKKTFCEGLNLASGIEVGFGGVWIGAAPYLMFIPRDGDKPVGLVKESKGQEVKGASKQDLTPILTNLTALTKVPGLSFTAYALLDGFGTQDTHETLNSFLWGPDGWLYGCHGVFTHSKIGKPGTPDEQRTLMNAGVWRYHPVRHVFEVFAHGTSNPWGLDYDQNGEFFVTACVIPHLYHIVPGARYHRQGGQHFNPYTYEDIETIADHAHYAGNIRDNAHWGGRDHGSLVQDDTNAAGGGHAHCGLAIYQSNQFPATYRNRLIFGNLHGHRLVTDYLDPHGSTYIGKHGSDFMRSNDMNFIPVTQKVGPDGSLYVSDWSDKQVCHRGSGAVEIWDRSNGRIYKVSYVGSEGVERSADTPVRTQTNGGEAAKNNEAGKSARAPFPKAPFDLAKESDETLAKLAVQTENEWFSRQARRVLMERVVRGTALNNKLFDLAELSSGSSSLRKMWLAYSLGVARTSDLVGKQLKDADERVRVAAVRQLSLPFEVFLGDNPGNPLKPGQGVTAVVADLDASELKAMAEVAKSDPSPIVRRELASALQRLPNDQRTPIARALLAHGEDKDDPYIPLLIWYGIEPLVGADPKAGLELAKVSKMPKVTEFIYRRMGAEESGRTGLLTVAAETKDAAMRDALLETVLKSARAGNKISKPENWAALRTKVVSALAESKEPSTQVEATLLELEAFMGDTATLQHFADIIVHQRADVPLALNAIRVVTQTKFSTPTMMEFGLHDILAGTGPGSPLKRAAIQSLAVLQHPDNAKWLVMTFGNMNVIEQQDAVNTLATTASGAKALLTAVKAKTIPSTMLSPFLARQLATLNNADVAALLKDTFGDLNAPKADLEERKKKFRALLTKGDLAAADKAKGKVLFSAVCGQCHAMFGEGQKVGPDLTGSNRGNLDYLLDNVLDPNAVIGKDYQLNIFELKDGRVASGVVKEDSPSAVRIAMPGGLEQTITTSEIKKRTVSKVSTMPEGLFDALPVEQLRQLVAYLQTNATPAKADTGRSGPAIKVEGAIEAETMTVLSKTGGSTRPQGMGGFGNKWSSGSQLWWTGAKPSNTLTLALPVAKAGKFAVKTLLTKARDYGICDIALDGKVVLTDFDGYNYPAVIVTDELDLGTHDLNVGEHKLTFTIKGTNPQAVKSYMVGIDYVKLDAR